MIDTKESHIRRCSLVFGAVAIARFVVEGVNFVRVEKRKFVDHHSQLARNREQSWRRFRGLRATSDEFEPSI